MTKTEISVKGDWLYIGKFEIKMNQYLDWVVFKNGKFVEKFRLLEQAINHCIEKNELPKTVVKSLGEVA